MAKGKKSPKKNNASATRSKKKSLRRKYDLSSFKDAFDQVSRGLMSVRTAATYFKIPRSTLQDKVNKPSELKSLGRPTKFPASSEMKLKQWAFDMCDAGLPVTIYQLMENAALLAKEVNGLENWKPGI